MRLATKIDIFAFGSKRKTSIAYCNVTFANRSCNTTYLMRLNILRQMSVSTSAKLETRSRRYEDAIRALNGLQSNYRTLQKSIHERDAHASYKIPEAIKLAARAGVTLNDIDKLSIIHVSGTKGKGSTCAMCESILRHHGFKTGFYSSPHLVEVRERIRINGRPIAKDVFTTYFWDVYGRLSATKAENDGLMPAYFRFLTILAFHVFLQEKVDVAIIEVGIGGQYDDTNMLQNPVVCGVTSLGLDHTSLLGNTIERIAWHKSGIFKAGVPAITVPQAPSAMQIILQRSKEKECPLYLASEMERYKGRQLEIGIQGQMQQTNANLALQLSRVWMHNHNKAPLQRLWTTPHTAVSTTEEIPAMNNYEIPLKTLDGLKKCSWPGRSQTVKRECVTYYIDGAHTYESIQQCTEWFNMASSEEAVSHHGKVAKVLIFNMTGDRDVHALLIQLKECDFDCVIFCPNLVYQDSNPPDLITMKVTQDNQMNRCAMMKELWEDIVTERHISDSSGDANLTSPKRFKHDDIISSAHRLDPVQDFIHLSQDAASEYYISSPPSSLLNSRTLLIGSKKQTITILPCVSEAVAWATQGRDKNLNISVETERDIPEHLKDCDHIQVLVTGSIHLVGNVVTVVDPTIIDPL